MRQLAPAARTTFLALFTQALASIFVVAAAIAVVGFLLTWLLPERPLRQTLAASAAEVAEGCATPPPDSPLLQIERGLQLLGSHDTRRALLERTAARAGVDPLAGRVLAARQAAEAPRRPLTAAGRSVLSRLRAARQEELAAALAGWSPERRRELSVLITDAAHRLADRPPEAHNAAAAGAG